MIKYYKKKSIIISALKWDGSNLKEVMDFMNGKGMMKCGNIVIPTIEGAIAAEVGSYIIKGVKGEYYPCRGDIFEDTYEEVK